uniref:Uncharacterized protein n=1 Tax=candidate division WOR-3 bacterium TaxID=2052148 RepID=A0A7C3N7C1_UNCW3
MLKFIKSVIILTVAINIFSQIGFNISPPKYEFTVRPEEIKNFTINVQNTTDSILHIKIYNVDWALDIENNVKYFTAGKLKNSCSNWIYVNPQEFNIYPNSSQDIRFTLSVPKNVFGDYWSMVFFESTPFNPTGSSMLLVSGRVGCTIYSTIAGTTVKNGDIVGLDFDKKDYSVKAIFENSGNVHLRIKGIMKILKDEKVVFQSEIPEKVSLPETKTTLSFPVETQLLKGKYTVKVNIDYSGNEILEGEKIISID